MKTGNFVTSSCRYCRYYQSEGRRGGTCQQLSVPVQAQWKACTLAASPFNSTWEKLEQVVSLEHSLTLNCLNCPSKAESSRVTKAKILSIQQPNIL